MNILGVVNLNAMGILPEAQLLATQIAAAGGRFSQLGLGVLGTFGGLQGVIDEKWLQGGPEDLEESPFLYCLNAGIHSHAQGRTTFVSSTPSLAQTSLSFVYK